MASDVALVLYSSVLFDRVGPPSTVRAWAERLERRFTANAKEFAPIRSGELRAGISGEVTRTGSHQLDTIIRSDAPHSLYVLKGTTGPIYSRRMFGFRGRTGLRYPRGGAFIVGARQVPNIPFLRERGYLLKVRAGRGFPQRYAVSVSGQEANNFFLAAASATAMRHSSLVGFAPATQGFDLV